MANPVRSGLRGRQPLLKCIRALLLSCLCLITLPEQQAAAQQFPRYELDLVLDLEARLLKGRAVIEVPASAVEDSTVRFDMSLPKKAVMDVHRITNASGRTLQFAVLETKGVEVRQGYE